MKQAKQKPKQTLADVCGERLKTLAEMRQEKIAAEQREKDRKLEDEMMAMIHGPNWRTQYAGEPEPEVPEPDESEVRLRAS